MIVLALASHVLENTLEIASDIESRPATKFSPEKLRACNPMVIKDKKVSFFSLSCLSTFFLRQVFSGKIGRLTSKGT